MKMMIFLMSIITLSLFLGYFAKTSEGLTPNVEPPKVEPSDTVFNIFYNLFNQSNIIILFWFLAIYYVLYLILNMSQQMDFISIEKFFDIVVFGIVALYIIITYLFLPSETRETILQNTGNSYLSYLDDPYSIFSLSLFLFVLYLILFFFSIPLDNDHKSLVISIVESLAWITFTLLIIVDFFKYFLGIPLVSFVTNMFMSLWWDNDSRRTDTSSNIIDMSKNEVFHISNNIYGYEDAQAVCSSFGATLANYNQINDYYNQGGEFCGYGWSSDQMALFPTQESTWQSLQGSESSKNMCGRPGINGGVFDPNYKFGVNCYGVKPPPTEQELSCMNRSIPKTPEQVALEEKVQYFKQNPDLTNIISFNNTKWSEW
jgi:hypothetical protein